MTVELVAARLTLPPPDALLLKSYEVGHGSKTVETVVIEVTEVDVVVSTSVCPGFVTVVVAYAVKVVVAGTEICKYLWQKVDATEDRRGCTFAV